MPVTSLAEIAARTSLWPINTVQYSQSGTASPTRHRPDCSGFASMCMGLPTPGENTVTLVTEGHARRIGWDEMQAGDLVMLGGLGTGGDAGHVGVVTAVHRDKGVYVMVEQSGGLGPDRNTYRIGSASRSGMVPYRSVYVTTLQEDDMPLYGRTKANQTVYVSDGLRRRPVSFGASVRGEVIYVDTEEQLTDLLGPPDSPAVVDVDEVALAKALAPLLDGDTLPPAVIDALAKLGLAADAIVTAARGE